MTTWSLMPRPKSQARRDALVGAAQRAMLEHGADTKLVHVAEAAGLTSGAVLYHFPDVQALLLEANRAGMERFYSASNTWKIPSRSS
jgi:AcrR family transcriptional regulator